MALTGYMISVYEDVNPYSPTYGQTRTEREQDTSECTPPSSGDWRIIYDYCEIVDLDYTGYLISVYQDVDPNSPTYGERLERRSYDEVSCPLDSNVPIWELIDTYCEQVAYQPSGRLGNTGYKIEEWRDANEYSDTYNQVEHRRIPDTVNCEVPDTNDIWVIQSETCHQVDNGSGIMVNDGTKIIVRVETNEYSPNYNFGQSETITVEDLENCPLAETSPDWVEQSYTCVLDEGYRTGDIIIVEEDVNPLSSTYGQQRTRTERDTNRCPVQPKPQPVNMPYRIINNRSIATDTITSIAIAFNDGVSITSNASLPPAGGVINGSYSLDYAKRNTDLTAATVTISPNATTPTQFQWAQSPSPYNWTTTSGGTLTITLTDGDGTAPVWTEQSYVCETSGGENTGNAIVTEIDINPNSATYNTTRTRTVQNDPRCPVDTSANWVELSYICELSNGYNTGNSISYQQDTNPNSPTYGSTRNVIIVGDTTRCPLSPTAAWMEVSYECEQQDGFNTGRTIITERDVNPGSSTYNQTRTRTVSDDARCERDTNPSWVEVSYVCEQITNEPNWVVTGYTCETLNGENTGNKIITETDTNPYSQSYNSTRTTTVEDTELCPVIDRTPHWVLVSWTCEQVDGENTGTAVITERDTNPNSPTYNQTRTYSELDSEYCPVPHNFKAKTTSSGGTVRTVACNHNGSTRLSKSEITDRNCVSAEVGGCTKTIESSAFEDCGSLSSVTIYSGTTRIKNNAFSSCNNLVSVTLPNTLTNIEVLAFMACDSLQNVTIPNSVTAIGNGAFSISGITTVHIPSSVTTIDNNPWSSCRNLASVTVDQNNSVYDSRNNCNAIIETSTNYLVTGCKNTVIPDTVVRINIYAFAGCSGLTSITIPDSVTAIQSYAFEGCTSLTSINIPSSVSTIGVRAFNVCSSLTSITVNRNTPPYLGSDAFNDTGNAPIYVPSASLNDYKSQWSNYSSRITALPNS